MQTARVASRAKWSHSIEIGSKSTASASLPYVPLPGFRRSGGGLRSRWLLQSVANCFSRGFTVETVADGSQTVAICFKPQRSFVSSPLAGALSRFTAKRLGWRHQASITLCQVCAECRRRQTGKFRADLAFPVFSADAVGFFLGLPLITPVSSIASLGPAVFGLLVDSHHNNLLRHVPDPLPNHGERELFGLHQREYPRPATGEIRLRRNARRR